MMCILKTPDMIEQVQKAVEHKKPTKIIIENFQKQEGIIFTSEHTSVELDDEVINIFNYKLHNNNRKIRK